MHQLQPGAEGIPIEIYAFVDTTDWIKFENIQADIFAHIIAMIPYFELSIFQNPTGNDFKNILHR